MCRGGAVRVLERHRPLPVRSLVARRGGGPPERHRPSAVGLVQGDVCAEQHAPQRYVGRTRRRRPLGRRQQLPQAIERRQDALQPEQRREVGRIGPQGREIDGRGLLVLAGALELEALANGLRRQHARGQEQHQAEGQQ